MQQAASHQAQPIHTEQTPATHQPAQLQEIDLALLDQVAGGDDGGDGVAPCPKGTW